MSTRLQEILDSNHSITKYLRPEVHEELKKKK